MSQLTKLVEFLDRDDVSEVVVATGRPVTLRVGGEYRALGRAPATFAQIEGLFAGSPVADLIASGGGSEERLRLIDRDVAVEAQLLGDQLLIRLSRARAAAPEPPRTRGSNPAIVAAPPLPRTRSRDHLMGPALAATAAAAAPPPHAPEPTPPRAPEPPPRAPAPPPARALEPRDDEMLGGLLMRADDGGASAGRDGSGRVTSSPAPPLATRRRAITMPPIAAGSAPALDAVALQRSDAPVSSPALSRHSIEMPPIDPALEAVVVPTAVAPPPARPQPPNSAAPQIAAPPLGSAPHAVPVAALAVAPTAPVAIAHPPAAPAPGAPSYVPARRHTITAAPAFEPLPPLPSGKSRATAELLAILGAARGRNASDLHLTGDRPPMERSARGLEPLGPPLSSTDVERMLSSLLSPDQRADLDARGYVDAAINVEGAGRLRANISRFRGGVKGSFRLVLAAPPTLEQLGLPRELARVTTYHQGLVVIAGPNGHGKTTTLAALVDLINSQKAYHIITIEDPVEILHPRKRAVMSQREVGHHTRSFAAALKASLREDPNVIVIGELRDRETVEIALTAAETGHLVMATMSTPSAAKSLDRLIDMFPPDDQQQVRVSLAAALKFVVAQRLVPSADGAGVVAAAELLTGVLPLAALIRDNKLFQVSSLQQRGRAFGMIRLDDSLADLVRAGKITEEAALRAADSKKDLAVALRAAAPTAPAARPVAPEPKRGLSGIFGAGRRE